MCGSRVQRRRSSAPVVCVQAVVNRSSNVPCYSWMVTDPTGTQVPLPCLQNLTWSATLQERFAGRPAGGTTYQRLATQGAAAPSCKHTPQRARGARSLLQQRVDHAHVQEFVVHVLERFFQKNREEATRIMFHVHRRGVGLCGVYTYEVAETKVTQVMDFARQHQHPLQCTLEKD